MIINHQILKFGASEALTLTLTASEQYSRQLGISETSKHDLRVKYTPLITNDTSVKLETRVYLSDDGLGTAEGDSTWYPLCYDDNDGTGNYDPTVKVYRNPALTADLTKRSTARQLEFGAKKVRFSFKEAGSPSSAGSIDAGTLVSRE